MNPDDVKRISDLRAALKRAKPDKLLSLDEVSLLWGTSKARFVTVRNSMTGFPDPMPAPKEMRLAPKAFVYPARKAIDAMLAHATRHDDLDRAKAERTAAMMGERRAADSAMPLHRINELQTINRMMAEMEERERQQGAYISANDVAAIAGEIFSEISEFFATLSNKIDPHGTVAADQRTRIDELARAALLRFHSRMKDMLEADAVPGRNRDQAGKPGKSRARRLGAKGVRVSTR